MRAVRTLRPTLRVARCGAVAVAALATEAVVSGLTADSSRPAPLLRPAHAPSLPPETHLAAILIGVALLATVPAMWRSIRRAMVLAVVGLLALVALNILRADYGEALIEVCLISLLAAGRATFKLGCVPRPRLLLVYAACAGWGLFYCALLLVPLLRGVPLADAVTQPGGGWTSVTKALFAGAALVSVLAVRSLLRPAPAPHGHDEGEHRAARAILQEHGHDSLSPFVLRPDKALAFGAGGVLSYRVHRGTAIVSSDPVAAPEAAGEVLKAFQAQARGHGWQVVVWAASARHLEDYRRLGLRALRVGEEAFVDPQTFTLEGRAVRKLRQSVHRVSKRGWQVSVHQGRQIDDVLEAEIDELEAHWRRAQQRLHGFAMGMGKFAVEVGPEDLYALGRAPDGRLAAVMRFAGHCGKLSLDTMHRVGETPNGLNEALVARVLAHARACGVREVSLNYAGLAHLVRQAEGGRRLTRVRRWALAPLHRRFQMDRLVRFNEKFSPEWRPRYLLYESRAALPRAVFRVLVVEGYLPQRPGLSRWWSRGVGAPRRAGRPTPATPGR